MVCRVPTTVKSPLSQSLLFSHEAVNDRQRYLLMTEPRDAAQGVSFSFARVQPKKPAVVVSEGFEKAEQQHATSRTEMITSLTDSQITRSLR